MKFNYIYIYIAIKFNEHITPVFKQLPLIPTPIMKTRHIRLKPIYKNKSLHIDLKTGFLETG